MTAQTPDVAGLVADLHRISEMSIYSDGLRFLAGSAAAALEAQAREIKMLRDALANAKRDLIPRAIVVAELRSWQEGAASASKLKKALQGHDTNLAKSQAWEFAAGHVEFAIYPLAEIDAALRARAASGE